MATQLPIGMFLMTSIIRNPKIKRVRAVTIAPEHTILRAQSDANEPWGIELWFDDFAKNSQPRMNMDEAMIFAIDLMRLITEVRTTRIHQSATIDLDTSKIRPDQRYNRT